MILGSGESLVGSSKLSEEEKEGVSSWETRGWVTGQARDPG